MLRLDSLRGIPEEKRNQIVASLDALVALSESGRTLSGYAWFNETVRSERIITFSHMHGTEEYKKEMVRDLAGLGYAQETIYRHIRDRGASYLWLPDFKFRDKQGNLFPCLKVKDLRNGLYIDLDKYKEDSLCKYHEFTDAVGLLLGENLCEWELNLPFEGKAQLLDLIALFERRAYLLREGETTEEFQQRKPWAGAYKIPLIAIGKSALACRADLEEFMEVSLFSIIENGNEINFIIHKNLDKLKATSNRQKLLDLGFKEEGCLANRLFVERYIDVV